MTLYPSEVLPLPKPWPPQASPPKSSDRSKLKAGIPRGTWEIHALLLASSVLVGLQKAWDHHSQLPDILAPDPPRNGRLTQVSWQSCRASRPVGKGAWRKQHSSALLPSLPDEAILKSSGENSLLLGCGYQQMPKYLHPLEELCFWKKEMLELSKFVYEEKNTWGSLEQLLLPLFSGRGSETLFHHKTLGKKALPLSITQMLSGCHAINTKSTLLPELAKATQIYHFNEQAFASCMRKRLKYMLSFCVQTVDFPSLNITHQEPLALSSIARLWEWFLSVIFKTHPSSWESQELQFCSPHKIPVRWVDLVKITQWALWLSGDLSPSFPTPTSHSGTFTTLARCFSEHNVRCLLVLQWYWFFTFLPDPL